MLSSSIDGYIARPLPSHLSDRPEEIGPTLSDPFHLALVVPLYTDICLLCTRQSSQSSLLEMLSGPAARLLVVPGDALLAQSTL